MFSGANDLFLTVKARPNGPYRLPLASPDRTLVSESGVLKRGLLLDGIELLLKARSEQDGQVLIAVQADNSTGSQPQIVVEQAMQQGLKLWRRSLGIDLDVKPFLSDFSSDQLVGRSIRKQPWLKPYARPSVFEALLCAITEQLITFQEAVTIQRRMVKEFGYRFERWGLSSLPTAQMVAQLSSAQIESTGLSGKRSVTLRECAELISSGAIDFEDAPEQAFKRLSGVREIGDWTLALVACGALGRVDMAPAGDLGLRKAVGRLLTGNPDARVDTDQVEKVLERYGMWTALAAVHMMAAPMPPKDPSRLLDGR